MDNHLTPNKIQKLMYLAEDRSFQQLRNCAIDEERKSIQAYASRSTVNYESSSGILDLEKIAGFGESLGLEDVSLSKSTAFSTAEMTGRSTCADDLPSKSMSRHSIALDSITSQMDKQTNEINDLMRHSIAANSTSTFHSKRNLTADEAIFIMNEAPLPVLPSTTQTHFTDSLLTNSSDMSVGAYFQNRCPDFDKILGKTDSPDRSEYSPMPLLEASQTSQFKVPAPVPQKYNIDETLDCIPVRQSRLENPAKLNINVPEVSKNYDKQNFSSTIQNIQTFESKNETYNKAKLNYSSVSKAPDDFNIPKTLHPVASSSFASHKGFGPSCKPTNLLKTLQTSTVMMTEEMAEDSNTPTESSLSISKIADYLAMESRESNISVTAMLKLNNKKPPPKKQPLTELHMNLQEIKQNEELQVTNLRDTKKLDTASSAGTISTVVNLEKLKISSKDEEIPTIAVIDCSTKETERDKKRSTRSRSPSSHSTMSTVQEQFPSFRSGNSPVHTRGDINKSHMSSPNTIYRELDKSVDWQEVLQQKRVSRHGLRKEQWADIEFSTLSGFVGVSSAIDIKITTLITESWLTARLQFTDLPNEHDLTIELPRRPFLLSPGKTEHFTVHLTSNIEINTNLAYKMFLKDASDTEIVQNGTLEVDIKLPIVQAMSWDGINKVTFPPIQEKTSLLMSFVLISDCPVDLQLLLSVFECNGMFTIKNVQEIKKSDVNKVLTDRQGVVEDQTKAKSKGMSKQPCRLSSGNAIKVTIKFSAPKLTDIQIEESLVTFTGALTVNLIGVKTVLRRVDLAGVVGVAALAVKLPGDKLQIAKEPAIVTLVNTGSITGTWSAKFAHEAEAVPFQVSPSKFDIQPGGVKKITVFYIGEEDAVAETTLFFIELSSGNQTALEISAGTEKPKTFPIRTNLNTISFVRPGRKDLSMKNSTDKKVYVRCHIVGEGFSIDLAGMDSRGIYCLTLGPSECRQLPIMFNPVCNIPHAALLHLSCEKNSDVSRSVRLFGCGSGECVRWSSLATTYGETAIVRAESGAPVLLPLYNRSHGPAFVCATVHFNLQYASVSPSARLVGSRAVVGGRSRHTISLCVDWSRVVRIACDAATSALATLTVLTGAELTRKRILRVLRDNQSGVLDTSLLDDHLKVLTSPLEGEDPNLDNMLKDFNETKASLKELISGLYELTAQIELPQDFAAENTIVITDDTVVEHHTLPL